MKIIFMGTPDFSVQALASLKQAGHKILCVYSQPPRKAGRGQREKNTPVHDYALANDWEVRTPISLKNNAEELSYFRNLQADIGIVVAYGLLLPTDILQGTKYGSLNIHASLLPRLRGSAPIQRAIENGEDKSGITIMQMDKGLDTGDILLTQELPLTPHTTAGTLHDTLSHMGADLICQALEKYHDLIPIKQDHALSTYAHKISKEETKLDFSAHTSFELERKIRAFSPFPATFFEIEENAKPTRIKILSATTEDAPPFASRKTPPYGSFISNDTLQILCKDNRLLTLNKIQKAGKKPMDVKAFLLGNKTPPKKWRLL